MKALRQRGVDVLTVHDTHLFDASDEVHLQRAVDEQRVIVNQAADYLGYNRAGVPRCGIVFAAQGTSVSALVRGSMLIWDVFDADEMNNHVEYL